MNRGGSPTPIEKRKPLEPWVRTWSRNVLVIWLFLLAASNPRTHGAEPSEKHGHDQSHHHIEATFGAAFHDGKTATFTGFEYEYRVGPLFGVGGFIDTTFSGFDLAAIGAVANFHPTDRWKVLAGLGVERKIGGDKDKALLRVGAAYEFHVGNGTIAPVIVYDFLEDTKDVLYAGVAIGFSF